MKLLTRYKLNNVFKRYEKLNLLFGNTQYVFGKYQFQKVSNENVNIKRLVDCFKNYREIEKDIFITQKISEEESLDVLILIEEELIILKRKMKIALDKLETLLFPCLVGNKKNIFLEIRAATGGNEASIFAGDLFRMYSRYSEQQKWDMKVINMHEGEYGGYKEIIVKLSGNNIFDYLKFESGTHRVQRIPTTESQGRIHTSTCTVAVMMDSDATNNIEINYVDLKIDTFKASGAGGQHVNKTDSAIRITHIPTNIVVECQNQRSQHKNKAQALSILKIKLFRLNFEKRKRQEDDIRRHLVGSGNRSERIRTYNYPQGRVTDHRISLTLYKLDKIMNGDLNDVIKLLIQNIR